MSKTHSSWLNREGVRTQYEAHAGNRHLMRLGWFFQLLTVAHDSLAKLPKCWPPAKVTAIDNYYFGGRALLLIPSATDPVLP